MIGSVAGLAGAQTDRQALLSAREAKLAERIADRTALDLAQTEAAASAVEVRKYQADLAANQAYCTAELPSQGAYNIRMAECQRLQTDMEVRRKALITSNAEATSKVSSLQDRLRQETSRLIELDAQIATLGRSSAFEAEMAKAKSLQSAQLRRLSDDVRGIVVPALPRTNLDEGIILGLTDGPREGAAVGLATSPVSGKVIGAEIAEDRAEIVTFGEPTLASELLRGLLDNQTYGSYTLATPSGREMVRQLQGKNFKVLIAHSNGATIAEALIRNQVISVDQLEIAGGDRSMISQDSLQQLIDSGQVKSVRVWINPGDPVPSITSTVLSASLRDEARFWAGRIAGVEGPSAVKVEVCVTDGAEGQAWGLDSHDLTKAYFPNMAAHRCRTE